MSEPYIGEVKIFPYNFAPIGWALCDGQELSIAENKSLFAIIGTTYGGDGRNKFKLPDLQGRAPIHDGRGIGLSLYKLGNASGSTTVELSVEQIPIHNHSMVATKSAPESNKPQNNFPAKHLDNNRGKMYSDETSSLDPLKHATPNYKATFSPKTVSETGGDKSHENMQPYLVLSFCIALEGYFPPRS
jgi:microcystin-dependent protein